VQEIYLARLDLADGSVSDVQKRSSGPMRMSGGSNPCPTPFPDKPRFAIQQLGVYEAAVGWIDNNLDATGCDVFVDGVILNAPGTSADLLTLTGNDRDLLAIWQERRLADDSFHIVFRRRDRATRQWTDASELGSTGITRLRGSASGPDGTLAIAWSSCTTSTAASCTWYLSKYVGGTWTTVEGTGGAGPSWPSLAINRNGQAVVAWSNVFDAKCSTDPTKTCPRAVAYRF
jgi:hypothetical protein